MNVILTDKQLHCYGKFYKNIMDSDFWLQTWQDGQIGFHEGQPNQLFVKYFEKLNLQAGDRIFLPLCGKTLDITWLLNKGYRVVGVELSSLAIEQLFKELQIEADVSMQDRFTVYSANNLQVFQGDFFDLTTDMLAEVDAVYDRAALVALPVELRQKYTAKLLNLTQSARQLLITFEYQEGQITGPPFSIPAEEVHAHYAEQMDCQLLDSILRPLRSVTDVRENIWLLSDKKL